MAYNIFAWLNLVGWYYAKDFVFVMILDCNFFVLSLDSYDICNNSLIWIRKNPFIFIEDIVFDLC